MINTVVYINDTPIDLDPSTVIAITVQKIDVGDLSGRSVNFTNQIKAPFTKTNDEVFGHARSENTSTSKPYTLFPCKVVQNGVEVIPDGRCFLKGVDGKYYIIEIYENLISIFESLSGLSVADVAPITATGWTASDIDTARLNTSNLIAALIDWGKCNNYTSKGSTNCSGNPNYPSAAIGDGYSVSVGGRIGGASGKLVDAGDIYIALAANAGGTEAAVGTSWFVLKQGIYNADFFLPCFFYHTIITKILTSTGLNLSGAILTDSRFTDLVVPYFATKFEYPSSLSQYDAKVSQNAFVSQGVGPDYSVPFNIIEYDQYGSFVEFKTNSKKYVALVSGNFDFRVDINVTLTYSSPADTIGILFTQLRNGIESTISDFGASDPVGAVNTFAIHNINVEPGDEYYFRTEDDVSNSSSISFLATGNSLTVTQKKTVSKTSVDWSRLLKLNEIKSSDFLRDFFTRFAIIPKQVSSTLFLKTLQEIITDTAGAVDWSNKRATNLNDPISFQSSYAQTNYFDHEDSDDVGEKSIGRGTFTIANQLLDKTKTIFGSAFQNSKDITVGGYSFASVPVYQDIDSGSTTEFANEPELRILTLKSRVAEAGIKFNTTSRTDYKLAYFADSTKAKDTGFQYFINQFYLLFTRSLQSNKVITRMYNLTEQDIAYYDPHKMVWDGEGYYIINRISNFIPGQITKVELFKVL